MARRDTRRRLFAANLAAGAGVPEAGASLGISERTAWRWAADVTVKAEVTALQDAVLARVAARLGDGATAALGWLEAVGKDPAAPHAARVSAGRVWLTMNLGYNEQSEIEARLAALEKKLGATPPEA